MANQIWLDVYDHTTLLRIGAGPVWRVQNAQIRRPLDGAGTFRVNCFATDPRALTLLQDDRIVRIWSEDSFGMRLRGEGIITDYQLSENPTGVGLKISGPDTLELLKRKNTLLGRIYKNQDLQDVVDDLITLAPGWSVELDPAIAEERIDARFDGINLFKAFRNLAKRYGYHIRAKLDGFSDPTDGSRTLQIGPFAQSIGRRINRVTTINSEALNNQSLLIPRDIKKTRRIESNNYYNTLIPIGAGEGIAALTLFDTLDFYGNGPGRPYPIQSMDAPDGSTIYYISTTTYPSGGYANFTEDPASAVKTGQYKDIAPLSNSLADRRNASQALYLAAAADLARSSEAQVSYDVVLKNVTENILPGDTVRMDYKAEVEVQGDNADETKVVPYFDESGDFYILEATEQMGLESSDVTLKLSNLDKFVEDELELIFDTIDSMEVRNLKPNLVTGPPSSYVFNRNLFAGFPITIPIDISDAVTELLRVRLRLTTSKIVTFLKAKGGEHRHRVAKLIGGEPFNSSFVSLIEYEFAANLAGDSLLTKIAASVGADWYTEGENTELELSITEPTQDTQTPTGITVSFDGTDVTNTLFGVATLAPSGGEINVLADPGNLANLLTGATGGLQQLHLLEIECASGRGDLEAIVEVFATTQAIKIPNT